MRGEFLDGRGAYILDGNHSAQSRPGTCSRSYRRASRVLVGCRLRRRHLALCMHRLGHPFHERSRKQSIPLGRHRSLQLFTMLANTGVDGRSNQLELAFRNVAAEHSERPMYFVFPARRISSSAGIDSVRGVSIAISIWNCAHKISLTY